MQPALLSLFRLMATSLTVSCLHAPMSWSPDGQWLAYTTVEPADTPTLKPGWLYDFGALLPARRGSFVPLDERPKTGLPRYRIWATERGSGVSVLIADAAYPLSSPAWGPDGHSLFYCRFVPRLPGTAPSLLRGQCELVVQESLDRQRAIMTLPDITLDRDQLATFCELKASWSPDGQYLAVPRPGRTAAILIVLPEQGRVLKTLDRASLPSWSPDSSRLTFVRTARDGSSTQTLQVIGHDFGAARALARAQGDVRAGLLEPGRSIGPGGGPTCSGAHSKLRAASGFHRFGECYMCHAPSRRGPLQGVEPWSVATEKPSTTRESECQPDAHTGAGRPLSERRSSFFPGLRPRPGTVHLLG